MTTSETSPGRGSGFPIPPLRRRAAELCRDRDCLLASCCVRRIVGSTRMALEQAINLKLCACALNPLSTVFCL
jgi:hypothetical protein